MLWNKYCHVLLAVRNVEAHPKGSLSARAPLNRKSTVLSIRSGLSFPSPPRSAQGRNKCRGALPPRPLPLCLTSGTGAEAASTLHCSGWGMIMHSITACCQPSVLLSCHVTDEGFSLYDSHSPVCNAGRQLAQILF